MFPSNRNHSTSVLNKSIVWLLEVMETLAWNGLKYKKVGEAFQILQKNHFITKNLAKGLLPFNSKDIFGF